MFPVYISKMDYTYKLIITVSKQEVHNRNCRTSGHRLAVSNNVKSRNVTLSDFDEIWYTTSDIEPGYGHVTKN